MWTVNGLNCLFMYCIVFLVGCKTKRICSAILCNARYVHHSVGMLKQDIAELQCSDFVMCISSHRMRQHMTYVCCILDIYFTFIPN